MLLLCEMEVKYVGHKKTYMSIQGQGFMYMPGRYTRILPSDE